MFDSIYFVVTQIFVSECEIMRRSQPAGGRAHGRGVRDRLLPAPAPLWLQSYSVTSLVDRGIAHARRTTSKNNHRYPSLPNHEQLLMISVWGGSGL